MEMRCLSLEEVGALLGLSSPMLPSWFDEWMDWSLEEETSQ